MLPQKQKEFDQTQSITLSLKECSILNSISICNLPFTWQTLVVENTKKKDPNHGVLRKLYNLMGDKDNNTNG